ncbi:MAG: acyl-CoA reductase [Armatimonadota bacterium]
MHTHFVFGEFIETEDYVSLKELNGILSRAEKLRDNMPAVGIDDIIEILHKTGLRWLRKSYHLRKKALKLMPGIVGFSAEMAAEAINQMAQSLNEKNLKRKIRIQLRDRYLLDKFIFQLKERNYLKLQSLGIVSHISAGNVFAGPVDSLVQGILTKNVNVLKLSAADPVFPLLFLESLREVDKDKKIISTIAAVAFKGGTKDIEKELKKRSDCIVVWGGDETVESYRKELPVKTSLIEYGPKISFSVLTCDGLKKKGMPQAAKLIAKDIVMWEQRACSSPQVIYIESKCNKAIGAFLEALASELSAIKKNYPYPELSSDEKVEITKARLISKMDEAFGECEVLESDKDQSWTIVYDKQDKEKPSPLNRFICVKPYDDINKLAGKLKKIRYYMQTASVLANPKEFMHIVSCLVSSGIDRVTEIGKMSSGKPGSPHDGKFELEQLLRWVNIESLPERFDIMKNLQYEEVKKPALFHAIYEIFDFSRKFSPFYKNLYKGREIKTWDDFYSLPVIDKHDLYKNTPPKRNKLLTGSLSESYIFSSGGTTGAPKFSFYTYEEFEQVTDILTDTYLSAGIRNTDVVANLFVAGNLWASFMAVNAALEKIGCVTMPVAGNSDMDSIISFLSSFKANAVLGLPSIILQLAHYIEAKKIKNIKIEKILYGGEHFTVEARKYLKKVLGTKIIRSAGYASVDAGPIGYQCEHTKDTVHHVLSDYVYVQIIDPETLNPVPVGQTGEITVTLLKRKFMPLIKYRTGDSGRIIAESCHCARGDVLFELLGRCDDVVRVGSVSIYPHEIEQAFRDIPGLSHIYQLVADTKRNKDILTVRIELKDDRKVDKKALSARIKDNILKQDFELAWVLQERWLEDLFVEILPPGRIPRTGAGQRGKVKRVVDNRKIK